eukprot:9982767-Alexandrium_andersonii.AAC.1
MSASLVGSEMCIRDSSVRCSDAVAPLHAPALAAEPGQESAPASSAAPVSYTHLTLPTICSV